MRTLILTAVLVTLCGGVPAEPERVFSLGGRRGPPPPARARSANLRAVSTRYITQPLDHEGSTDKTFQMRYIVNDQFFSKDGSPILLMVGGEWSINSGFVTGGHMYEIARDIGAYLIYTEHRYYGTSMPVENTSTENLKFLIVDQALADVNLLLKKLKEEARFANSKVVVFGGSYAGNMATWIRLKYPEIIDGAVASSGPVLAKADFYAYLETVGDAMMSEGSQDCVDAIRDGVSEAKKMLQTAEGTKEVSELFGTCEVINTSNELDVQSFFSVITEVFSGLVQYASAGQIPGVCASLVNEALGTPVQRVARYVRAQARCHPTEYQSIVEHYSNVGLEDSSVATTRAWIYQTCTEYGYYQTTTSKNQPFGDTFPLTYFTEHLCPDLYGKSINSETLAAGIARTNSVYNGLTPNITNVISVHGSIDPWHRLGIVEDLSSESPAVLIEGTSHCVDLQGTSFLDIPALTSARQRVRTEVLKWLN